MQTYIQTTQTLIQTTQTQILCLEHDKPSS